VGIKLLLVEIAVSIA